MKINLTKKQYVLLIKILYLGTWMANAHRTDDKIEEFEEFEQYILSFSKNFGMEDSVEYDEGLKMFFLTEEFINNSGVQELIDEYDNDTFGMNLSTGWQQGIWKKNMEKRPLERWNLRKD